MYEVNCDVAIIGGGPAGLAAAVAAKEEGAEHVLILERDKTLGGILQQCIHAGFGLRRFQEELTGPEYYGRYLDRARELGVESLLNAMVLQVNPDAGEVVCVNRDTGLTHIRAGSVVLAMGCRERTRANIVVPGTRPAGLYTAGSAQRLLNRQNILVGKKIVILGSGDIGMIMARRMTLEGAQVAMVVEIMPYLSGLTRNRVQCLDDFNIPLRMCHTITRIEGNERVTGVWVAPVDEARRPIPEQEEFVPCDTVLFSVGLIPENELTRACGIQMDPVTGGPVVNQYMQCSAPAIFACGNAVQVHDLVDNVSAEGALAGRYAARYAMNRLPAGGTVVSCAAGRNVRYVCPQTIRATGDAETVELHFRVQQPEENVSLVVRCGETVIARQKAPRANPGEMQRLSVDTAQLTGDTLTVEVLKEG